MKHRLLNFLLLAAMLCVGISAHADTSTVGNTDNSSGFASAFSDIYTLKANESLHLEFTNNNDGSANNWHNWLLFLDSNNATGNNTTQYFCLRADKWAWNSSYDSNNTSWYTSLTTSDGYFDSFMTDMNGAKVVLDIVRSGKTVTTTAKATSTGSKELTETFVIDCGDGTQEVYAFLSVENAHIVIDNAATKISDSNAPVTVADIDFSNSITGSYEILGAVNKMTWTNQWTTVPSVEDGALRFGNFTGTVALPDGSVGKKDKVTINFDLAFGKLTKKHIGFNFVDTDGNPFVEQLFDAYNADFDDMNPLGLDWANMYRGSNTVIQERCTSFNIEIDYSKGTITTTTRCYMTGKSNPVTEKVYDPVTFDKAKIFGAFQITGNINNNGRYSTLDNLIITVTPKKPEPPVTVYERGLTTAWADADVATDAWAMEPAVATEGKIDNGALYISATGGSRALYNKNLTPSPKTIAIYDIVWNVGSSYGDNNNYNYIQIGDRFMIKTSSQGQYCKIVYGPDNTEIAVPNACGKNNGNRDGDVYTIHMEVNTMTNKVIALTINGNKGNTKVAYDLGTDNVLVLGKGTSYEGVRFGINRAKNGNKWQWLNSIKMMEQIPDAEPADYTVNFITDDNDAAPGTVLKTAVPHAGELNVGDEATASDEEMHLFDVGGTRYIYTKSDTIALSDDPAANILNVYFHKALNYDWEVVGKYDKPTNVFSIENGTALEGDTLEVTYRQFYVKDGIQYKTSAAADGRYVYRFPIVKQETPATVQVDTLFYTKVGPVEIVEELEDAPGLVVVANEKCSGGNYAYTPTDDFVQVTTKPLDPGTYTLTIGTFDEKKGDGKTLSGNYFVFNAVPRGSVLPTTEADRFTTAAYGVGALQHDITIYTPSYLYMKGGEAGVGIDYITVARSGDLNEASGYVNVPDSLAEDVLTEMATISADEFDVNISPSQIVEVDGKRYLQMENGTVTIQCTTGRAVKDVKFIGLPEDYTWDYVTSDLGTIDSLHWTMTEGFDKVIFTFTKPELIAGISVGGYLPGQAKTYYKADYEEGATTAGWTTSVGGRYDPEVIEEDGNHFLSIKQDSRYNNGASFKGTVLKGALPEDVTDFTLEFDMRLGGTNNQIPNLQFLDAEGKSMLTLTLQAVNGSVWTINNKAEMTLDLKNSAYKSGGSGRLINEIDWYSYKLSHKDGLNYLTVVHKATGDVIYNQEPLESDAVNGGVGDIVFATARYFANIAFDNIVLREILPDDVPNITISQYTIKWVAEDGVALHEDYTTNAIVGNKVAANAEQVAPIVIDGKKYIYTSGNDSLLVNADAATNILTLNYRVAKTFSWTERGTSPDGILGVIARGEGFEGDAVTVAYPRYMLDKKNRLQYRDPENNQYRTTVTLTKDKQMINISYDLAEDAPQNVIFYSEGENLEGALISNAANTVVRSSNAAAGFYTEDTKILELKPGYYTITAVGFFGSNGGGSVKFTDGTQTLFMVSSTAASNATAATGEFELTENTSLYLAAGSNTVCLDYMFIQTEDGGLVTDGIANVKAAYEQGAVYNLKGQKVADSLEGLKAGLYIVNGHKVAVK